MPPQKELTISAIFKPLETWQMFKYLKKCSFFQDLQFYKQENISLCLNDLLKAFFYFWVVFSLFSNLENV